MTMSRGLSQCLLGVLVLLAACAGTTASSLPSCADLLQQRYAQAAPYLEMEDEPSDQDALDFEVLYADIQHLEHKTRVHGADIQQTQDTSHFLHSPRDQAEVERRNECAQEVDPWAGAPVTNPAEEAFLAEGPDAEDDEETAEEVQQEQEEDKMAAENGQQEETDDKAPASSGGSTPPWLIQHRPPQSSIDDGEIIVDPSVQAIEALPREDKGDGILYGTMDTHEHVFSHLSFGGRFLYGRPTGSFAKTQRKCSGMSDHGFPIYGGKMLDTALACTPWGAKTHVSGVGRYGYVDGTDKGKDFAGWPSNVAEGHQQLHINHIYRAYQRGQRALIVTAVNNELICLLTKALGIGFPNRQGPAATDCTDYTSIKMTAEAARKMAARHKSWMEIAYTAAEFRRIVKEGKLAIILALETSDPFIDTYRYKDKMVKLLEEYRGMGFRVFQIVHEFNNAFSGAARHAPLLRTATNLLHSVHKVLVTFKSAKRLTPMQQNDLGNVEHAKKKIKEFRQLIRRAKKGDDDEELAALEDKLEAAKEELKLAKKRRRETNKAAKKRYRQDTKDTKAFNKRMKELRKNAKKAEKERAKREEEEMLSKMTKKERRKYKRKKFWGGVKGFFKGVGNTFQTIGKVLVKVTACPSYQGAKIGRIVKMLGHPMFKRPRDQQRADENGKGNVGLKSAGKVLIKELMKRHLLVDIAHMSPEAIYDSYAISTEQGHYPLWYSHGGVKHVNPFKENYNSWDAFPEVLSIIMKTGGIFGLRTQGQTAMPVKGSKIRDCPGTSTGPARIVEFLDAIGMSKTGIATGGDLNGWATNVAGKWHPHFARVCYKNKNPERRLGTRYDVMGVARIDAMPDFVQDLHQMGTRGSGALLQTVEHFARMWERVDDDNRAALEGTMTADQIKNVVHHQLIPYPKDYVDPLWAENGLAKDLHLEDGTVIPDKDGRD